ncbi:MAG TPA: metal-dependent hydrolase [Nevskia sp.]|nr:metal-dependent hydrolase [Nevskia sp.]
MKQTTVTSGYPIVPRTEVDFDLDGDIPRHWFGGDAFKSRFFDAMSTLFPEGEKFFITCVRDYRDQITDPELQQQVKDFMRQEAQHGRVHKQFNDRLQAQGVRVDVIEAKTREMLIKMRRLLPASFTLAQTAAAEHMTSIMAHSFFERHEVFADADPRIRAMYLWHGVEEIEHKAVAYDVMKNVAKSGYFLRTGVMLYTSVMFPLHVFLILRHMLVVDGFSFRQRMGLWARGLRWLYGWNGLFRPLLGHYLAYYRPGFHPWQDGEMQTYQRWADAYARTGGDAVAAGNEAYAGAA